MNNDNNGKHFSIATLINQNKILHGQIENLQAIVKIQHQEIELYRKQLANFKEMELIIEEMKNQVKSVKNP